MTKTDIEDRANSAARLLNDPMLIEALELIEAEIIEQWEACPVRDIEGRETVWRLYKTAKKFRDILKGAVESGTVAELQERNRLSNPFRLMRKTAS